MRISDRYDYGELRFKDKNIIKIPDAENKFITEEMLVSPLYKKIKINKNMKAFEFFPMGDVRIECYCNECKKRRIYSFVESDIAINSAMRGVAPGSHEDIKNSMEYELERMDFFTLHAEADCKHKMIILFRKVDNATIMKVGQFPSIYDLNENINDKDFIKILGDEYSDYYKKACSLYSFNTNIGAMVYLRRIYEKLLLDTFINNESDLGITIDEFKMKKIDEKTKFLKDYLPSLMFSQGFNIIYKKISDGIHNLDENECFKMFPILKMGIEEILIERLEKEQKSKRIQELSKELQKV